MYKVTNGDLRPELLNKKRLSEESSVYASLLSVGYDILDLEKYTEIRECVLHMAGELAQVARYTGNGKLYDIFFDIAEDYWGSTGISDNYISHLKDELDTLADEAYINPVASGAEQVLLDRYTLPIHQKMVKTPEKSPEYFIELATILNKLIIDSKVSPWAASKELSYALDRPQIVADASLDKAVHLAHRLELPETIRQHDPLVAWKRFYDALPNSKK
jgi:hypothetical protein